jgi:FkbM family methyltransferase
LKLFTIDFLKKIKLINYKHAEGMNILKEFILNQLPPQPIIIDCGAHIGIDSLELVKFPESTIYSFEPIPNLYNQLIEKTKNITNITCFNVALSDYDGYADMYVSGGESDGSSSLLKPKEHINDHPEVTFNEIIKVKCKKLDSWAHENNVTKIDLLWLDMQGAEQRMLCASDRIFNTVSVIHSEVSTRETYEGVQNYNMYKKFLFKKGFKVLIEAIPQGYDMGNVLFVRK